MAIRLVARLVAVSATKLTTRQMKSAWSQRQENSIEFYSPSIHLETNACYNEQAGQDISTLREEGRANLKDFVSESVQNLCEG